MTLTEHAPCPLCGGRVSTIQRGRKADQTGEFRAVAYCPHCQLWGPYVTQNIEVALAEWDKLAARIRSRCLAPETSAARATYLNARGDLWRDRAIAEQTISTSLRAALAEQHDFVEAATTTAEAALQSAMLAEYYSTSAMDGSTGIGGAL